ncbi:MAG: hypothetical protein WD065_07985 [Planctomycetaceae bacterium]
MMRTVVWMLICCGGLVGATSGCHDAPLEYTEVRRIDEQITEHELRNYLELIKSLPNELPPEFPQVYTPPADWLHTRQLPVRDLVLDELKQIRERWDVDYLAQKLEKDKALSRSLNEARMTPQQFAGLTLALGAAYGRAMLRDDQELKTIIDNGAREIGQLDKVDTPFANLRDDEKYSKLKQAAWLTRQNRAEQLILVPLENVQLVHRYQEELKKALPPQFLMNPLDDVADLLLEKGLPFDIIDGSPHEDDITWDPADAIVGYDTPDVELSAVNESDLKNPPPSVESLPEPASIEQTPVEASKPAVPTVPTAPAEPTDSEG